MRDHAIAARPVRANRLDAAVIAAARRGASLAELAAEIGLGTRWVQRRMLRLERAGLLERPKRSDVRRREL